MEMWNTKFQKPYSFPYKNEYLVYTEYRTSFQSLEVLYQTSLRHILQYHAVYIHLSDHVTFSQMCVNNLRLSGQ
jgi:hypothetical protein